MGIFEAIGRIVKAVEAGVEQLKLLNATQTAIAADVKAVAADTKAVADMVLGRNVVGIEIVPGEVTTH